MAPGAQSKDRDEHRTELLLGPVSGLLHPDQLLGPLLFAMVSLAVALILFEGNLSLRFHELPGIGSAVLLGFLLRRQLIP